MTRTTELVEKSPEERLQIYNMLISSCTHLYSKNKLQEAKFIQAAELFTKLAKEDPIFMVHFAAYSAKKDSKDLQILSLFFNALNDADGSPFFSGSKINKPNFRTISAALLQNLSPHLANRVLELTRHKFEVKNYLSNGAHYPSFLKNAFRKYMLYRENNLDMIRGIKRNGLGQKFTTMYRMLHMAPTPEAASILGWKQKDKEIVKEKMFSFDGMNATQIAESIIENKLSPLVALSALPEKTMNAKIAKALLDNCTGNQAIILQNMFRRKSFLEVEEIKNLFNEKVKTATTAVDRIDTLAKNLTTSEKKEMSETRSKMRKQTVGKIGKVFIHLDTSGSMNSTIQFAKDKGAIFAECVENPEENFDWAAFANSGRKIQKPKGFTKEDFYAALYGTTSGGSTDCLATYKMARDFGADIDVFITDQGHNIGHFKNRLSELISKHGKPSAVIIIDFNNAWRGYRAENGIVYKGFEELDIPVSCMTPDSLNESALVAQSVQNAIKGKLAIIDEILETELPKLPNWYFDKGLEEDYQSRLNVEKSNSKTKMKINSKKKTVKK